MNKAKRKRLGELRIELEQIQYELEDSDQVDIEQIVGDLTELRDLIEEVKGEEEDVRDNYPENLQSTEIYDTMCAAVDTMDNSIMSLEAAIENLEYEPANSCTALDYLTEAISCLEEI